MLDGGERCLQAFWVGGNVRQAEMVPSHAKDMSLSGVDLNKSVYGCEGQEPEEYKGLLREEI